MRTLANLLPLALTFSLVMIGPQVRGEDDGSDPPPEVEVPGTVKPEEVDAVLAPLTAADIRSAGEVERRLAALAPSLDDASRARAYQRLGERLAQLGPSWCKTPNALESLLAEERVPPRPTAPTREHELGRIEPPIFGMTDSRSAIVVDTHTDRVVSGEQERHFPLHPTAEYHAGIKEEAFGDWAKHWRRIEHHWDQVEAGILAGGWTVPLKVQRSSYEIEQIEDAGQDVRPLTAAGQPVSAEVSEEGVVTVTWGEHTLVALRVAKWRTCGDDERNCAGQQPPFHLEAWLWPRFVYVRGLIGDLLEEAAVLSFVPPSEMPQPLIVCSLGAYSGLTSRVRGLLASHRAPLPVEPRNDWDTGRSFEVSETLTAIARAMEAKDAKALKPLLRRLGKEAARPRDLLVPAWLAWLEEAHARKARQEKMAKQTLAAVPKHVATCKAQIEVFRRSLEAERQAAAAGQVEVAMAKAKAKQNAAKLVCAASEGLEAAVLLYKELGMSASADAIRQAHRFCFDICR